MNSTTPEKLTWMHIHNLKLNCMVGLQKWERHIPQNLYLDISFAYARPPGHGDNIRKVIDYAKIAEAVTQYCSQNRHLLLETWMDAISERIFERFPACQELRLALSKPGALERAERVTLSCGYRRS